MKNRLMGPRLNWLRKSRDWQDEATLLHEELSPADKYAYASPVDCWITLDFEAGTENQLQLRFRKAEAPSLHTYYLLQDHADLYLTLVTISPFILFQSLSFFEDKENYHCVIDAHGDVLRLEVDGVTLFTTTGAFLHGTAGLDIEHDYGEENDIELRVYE